MTTTKQTGATKKAPPFFDRKILQYGESRCVALTKVIPKNWEYARITLHGSGPNSIVIQLERLVRAKPNASTTPTNKNNRKNT